MLNAHDNLTALLFKILKNIYLQVKILINFNLIKLNNYVNILTCFIFHVCDNENLTPLKIY